MIGGGLNMDYTCCIMRMEPVETGLITGNANLCRKCQGLPIDIHSEMSMNMKGSLFLLVTINIIYGWIIWVDNLLRRRLGLSIGIDDIGNDSTCNHQHCHDNTDDRNTPSFFLTLALCIATNLLFTAFFT